jgi:hypothetical protein
MSFNLSWSYSLPGTWNPVISGTRITTAWANGTLNDIATALNALAVRVTTIPPLRKSAAYTVVPDDVGKCVTHPASDATARIFTIQLNATSAWPDGAMLTFKNGNGAGVVTITPTDTMRLAGTTSTGNRSLAANGIATAIWDATDAIWLISGTGLT